MPIDPNIILGVRPPVPAQATDPLANYARVMGIKHAMGQGDLQDLQIRQARTGIEDEEAQRQALIDSAGDMKRYRQLLGDRGQHKALLLLDKNQSELDAKRASTDKDRATTAKTKFDTQMDKLSRGAAMLNEARDQASYEGVLRMGVISGVFAPEAVEKFPKQYSPQAVAQLKAAGLDRAKQLEHERALAQQAETGRHNQESERTARGTLGVAQGNLGVARERLQIDRDQPRGVLNQEGTHIVDPRSAVARPVVTADGRPVQGRLTDAQKKELSSIESQRAQVQGAIEAVKASPSAFSMARGAATMAGPIAESAAGRLDSDPERQARSYVFNVVSKVINERAGAAQSAQELARLRSFLPAETDNAEQIESKLTGFTKYLDDSRSGYDAPQGPGPRPQPTPTPTAPTVFNSMPDPAKYSGKRMEADDGTVYKSDGKKWVVQARAK